jgi:hypothetical protein
MKNKCSFLNLLAGLLGVLRNIGLWIWLMLAAVGLMILVLMAVVSFAGRPPENQFWYRDPIFVVSQLALAAAVVYGLIENAKDVGLFLAKIVGGVVSVGGAIWYGDWVVSAFPAVNGNWFNVFSLGHASLMVRAEVIPAQIFVALVALAGVAIVLGVGWCVLDEMCKYGRKLRDAKAAKTVKAVA